MSLKAKFEKYDKDNPEIYLMFDKFAREMIAAGCKVLSARLIIERIRWETIIRGSGEYKINDNYTAYFARKWMEENKKPGLFRTRVCKSA